MWYIVYKSKEDGYFVSYKDKGSDYFSKNYLEAKKYKTLGPAMSRLGISVDNYITSFDRFLLSNNIQKAYIRELTLSNLLGTEPTYNNIFKNGRIDILSENGEIIGTADKMIIDLVKSIILKNSKRKSTGSSAKFYNTPNIVSHEEGNFWDGF